MTRICLTIVLGGVCFHIKFYVYILGSDDDDDDDDDDDEFKGI